MKTKRKFDLQKLKGKIREENNTQEKIAQKMGISIPTMVNKLNNRSEFTQSEIVDICEILDIPNENVKEYFFKEKVKKT